MDTKGYYLKPGVKATAPGVLFSVIVTPTINRNSEHPESEWHEWQSAAVCCSHFRRERWQETRFQHCDTPEQLHTWMSDNSDRQRRNYVVCPDASQTFAMARFWDLIDKGEVKYKPFGTVTTPKANAKKDGNLTTFRRLVISPRCCILDYARHGTRWLWLSGHQFFSADEESLAKSMQIEWNDTAGSDVSDGLTVRTATERAMLWLGVFQRLSDWWLLNAKAPFGMTASSCSMGILRTHIPKDTLCTHTDPDVLPLERAACFGGRATTWYYGDIGLTKWYGTEKAPAPAPSQYGYIPGPVHQVDVRSMYPYLLREMEFPRMKIGYTELATVSDAVSYAKSFGVIARVVMKTEVPEYPCRTSAGIIYPVGQFTTTLTGPELLRAHQDSTIVRVEALAKYLLGRPFRAAADALIQMRERARAEGQPAWELFAKLLANGLGGKLAQRKGEWLFKAGIVPPVRFGEWFDIGAKAGKRTRYRTIAGLTWGYNPDDSGAGPYTAAFAYLTAYGRLHMRAIRELCPHRSVVSMDTDGLWLLDEGFAAVQSELRKCSDLAGSLREVCIADAARFLSPRHYFVPGEWVLSGFHSPRIADGARMVHDSQSHTPISGPCGLAPRGVAVRHRDSELAPEHPGMSIGEDGWARPRYRRGILSPS